MSKTDKFKAAACRMGFHDAYLTRCLLGFDFKCRVCGRVRYRDVDPSQWARHDGMRAQGIYLPDPFEHPEYYE